MASQPLQTAVAYLKGVGPGRARLLASELGVETFQDLLYCFPNRHIDKTRFYTIGELQRNSADVLVKGQVIHLKTVEQKRGKRLVATFRDATGEMELVWFRSHRWFRERIKLGEPYVVFGRVNWFKGGFSMAHPEMELLKDFSEKPRIRMQPVYPSTEKLSRQGITNRMMTLWIAAVLKEAREGIRETLPERLLDALRLIRKREALVQVHFPDSAEHLARAQARLKFEELFYIQLALLSKKGWEGESG